MNCADDSIDLNIGFDLSARIFDQAELMRFPVSPLSIVTSLPTTDTRCWSVFLAQVF